jgi:serine/threonine protein kinase
MILSKALENYITGEVAQMRLLSSKYIVRLISAHLIGKRVSFVLEYADAGSLSLLLKHRALTEREIAYFTWKILKGLKFMHQHRSIHRDLKSDNIFLDRGGKVKIGDLGFATSIDLLKDRDEDLVGSPFWMAPEVIRSQKYSTLSDIWSLGAMIREMADAAPPYSWLLPGAAMKAISRKGLPPISRSETRSPEMLNFLERCNGFDPNMRESAEKLLEHPFLRKRSPKSEIVELISEAECDYR